MVHLRSTAKRTVSEQATIDVDCKEAIVEPSPESDCDRPVKKRRRGGAMASKKRKATKEHRGLSQLCIDELYIVFAYVYPMDLLNLARTCKYFRSFLMHKSSQFLWRDALSGVKGLPDCPVDLTEPQYTNLVFYARCHICDKPAPGVLWNLRRRYCPACKVQRLSYFSSCDWHVQHVLPRDKTTVGRDGGLYVDKDQLDLFMAKYQSSTDKEQFMEEKMKLYLIISKHARDCAEWRQGYGRVKRFDLEILRKERQESILERLRQSGYGPEIEHFSCATLQYSYKNAFKQHARLTDSEWEQMRPKWVDIMNDLRLRRLDATCYQARRRVLVSEYNEYVKTPGTPAFDLLPHVADLASFSSFRDIIEAPEGTQMGEEHFASAFGQLPTLIPDWKQRLDTELAELVKIPPHLGLQDASSPKGDESNPKDPVKLHLACALFRRRGVLFTHHEVFLTTMCDPSYPSNCGYLGSRDQASANSVRERYNISFLAELPYIVHACGLDPNVATVDDMDRRNARFRCLVCSNSRNIIMNWRDTMLHSLNHVCQNRTLVPLSESPRWEVISDDHIEAIQAIEMLAEDHRYSSRRMCLLCRPRMGDGLSENFVPHMQRWHGLDLRDLKEGIHYAHLGLDSWNLRKKVQMVEEGGQVIFRQHQYR